MSSCVWFAPLRLSKATELGTLLSGIYDEGSSARVSGKVFSFPRTDAWEGLEPSGWCEEGGKEIGNGNAAAAAELEDEDEDEFSGSVLGCVLKLQ